MALKGEQMSVVSADTVHKNLAVYIIENSTEFKDTSIVEEALLDMDKSKNCLTALLSVSNESIVVSGFNTDRAPQAEALRAHPKKATVPAEVKMDLGLASAISLFNEKPAVGPKKTVYIFSSGQCPIPNQQVTQLKRMGVKIYTIAVGSAPNAENLKLMSSANCSVTIPDMYTIFQSEECDIHPHEINIISARLLNSPLKFSGNAEIELVLMNAGFEPIPKGTRALFIGGNYWYNGIATLDEDLFPQATVSIRISLMHSGGKFLEIYNEIPVLFTNANGSTSSIVCKRNLLALRSDFFIGDIINRIPKYEIGAFNIGMIGIAGTGKSSHINAEATALNRSNSEIVEVAPTSGHQEHTTLAFKMYDMAKITGIPSIHIRYMDMWGVDANNWGPEFIARFSRGDFPYEIKMNDSLAIYTPSESVEKTRHERRIHTYLLFVPPALAMDEKLLPKMKTAVETLNNLNIPYLVLITKKDQITDESAKKKEIAKILGAREGNVYCVKNYTTEESKSFAVDKLNLYILVKTLESAERFITSELAPKNIYIYVDGVMRDIPISPEMEIRKLFEQVCETYKKDPTRHYLSEIATKENKGIPYEDHLVSSINSRKLWLHEKTNNGKKKESNNNSETYL